MARVYHFYQTFNFDFKKLKVKIIFCLTLLHPRMPGGKNDSTDFTLIKYLYL